MSKDDELLKVLREYVTIEDEVAEEILQHPQYKRLKKDEIEILKEKVLKKIDIHKQAEDLIEEEVLACI